MTEIFKRLATVGFWIVLCTLAGAAIGASAAEYVKGTMP